jgi:hypothetical protein
MSILIKNVELPTDHPLWIVVHSDGTVEANEVSASRPVGWQTLRNAAVPVPPHGRLIDADALDADLEWQDMHTGEWDAVGFSIKEIENAPTIIEAEE